MSDPESVSEKSEYWDFTFESATTKTAADGTFLLLLGVRERRLLSLLLIHS